MLPVNLPDLPRPSRTCIYIYVYIYICMCSFERYYISLAIFPLKGPFRFLPSTVYRVFHALPMFNFIRPSKYVLSDVSCHIALATAC
jgi:hypothetical protein